MLVVGVDEVVHGLGQREGLGQSDLSLPRPVEPVAGVGDDGEVGGSLRGRDEHRRDDPIDGGVTDERAQPRPATGFRVVDRRRVRGGLGGGAGDWRVLRTPQSAQVIRTRRIGRVQRRQTRRQHVEALAAVLSGLGDAGVDCVDEGRPQQVGVIGNEIVGKGGGATLLAAVDRPDQRVVAGVEFRDSAFLLDDGRSVESDAGLRRHDQPGAQTRRDAHPAERSDGARHDPDHRGQGAQIQDGRTDLGDSVETEVGLLQAHSTRLEEDHGGDGCPRGSSFPGGEQQCLGDLGAGHFAGPATLEALLDGGDHDGVTVYGAAGDDGAVIGLWGDALRCQPRGFEPVERAGEHPRGAGIEECGGAAERVEFDEAAACQQLLPALPGDAGRCRS